MIILIIILIILCLFILAPTLMIGLSKVFCVSPFSYKESLILCLQISGVGILFQLIQFAIITWLPPTFSILNVPLSVIALIIIISIIKRKFKTTIPKAILIQIINIAFAIGIALTFRHYLIQAYKIPAGSNIPTILIGDHVLVNKYIYRFREPQKNDWIIFKSPQDEKVDYLKRVVALPGDELQLLDKKLYVNDQRISEPFIVNSSPSIHKKSESPRDNFGPVTVPQNSYFVLGDNRDNSFDSRFFGFVKRDKIKGKAEIVYFSYDSKTKSIRSDRIGMKIK